MDKNVFLKAKIFQLNWCLSLLKKPNPWTYRVEAHQNGMSDKRWWSMRVLLVWDGCTQDRLQLLRSKSDDDTTSTANEDNTPATNSAAPSPCARHRQQCQGIKGVDQSAWSYGYRGSDPLHRHHFTSWIRSQLGSFLWSSSTNHPCTCLSLMC